jgi:hypothetical protein
MRSWVALLLLSACNHDRALENDRCTGSIEEFCAGGQCPLSRDDWCAGGMPFPFYGFNGMAACNGWSFVVQQDLDQPRYYFYDSTGKLVAVLAAVSDPPCLGACSWVCSAGPADQSAAQLSCSRLKMAARPERS